MTHTLELREVYIVGNDVEVEEPDLNEYYLRLLIGGYFDMKTGKKDINSVGHTWYRAHAGRLGIRVDV